MKNEITQSIKNIISYYARKYSCGNNWKYDEITQELYMSVLKSDENFKEDKNVKFHTYAIANIKYTMFTILSNQNINCQKKKEENKNDFTADFCDFSADLNADLNADFFDFSSVFCERTAKIFDMRFNKEKTLREISEVFNISKQRIQQIIKVNLKNKKLIKKLNIKIEEV